MILYILHLIGFVVFILRSSYYLGKLDFISELKLCGFFLRHVYIYIMKILYNL